MQILESIKSYFNVKPPKLGIFKEVGGYTVVTTDGFWIFSDESKALNKWEQAVRDNIV